MKMKLIFELEYELNGTTPSLVQHVAQEVIHRERSEGNFTRHIAAELQAINVTIKDESPSDWEPEPTPVPPPNSIPSETYKNTTFRVPPYPGPEPTPVPQPEPNCQGLYHKYHVSRTDGQVREGCNYFVLDMDHDPFAPLAMLIYAWAAKGLPQYHQLAQDIFDKYPEHKLPVSVLDWVTTQMAPLYQKHKADVAYQDFLQHFALKPKDPK